MSSKSIIAISPSEYIADESSMINRLFEAGLYRYHIDKAEATEQSIADILKDVEPKYLSQITLHSHFHLVLAYGVGGIHYTLSHRLSLADDYPEKIKLYQSFGVKVSTEVSSVKDRCEPADYAILTPSQSNRQDGIFQLIEPSTPFSENLFLVYQLYSQTIFDQCLKTLMSK